MNDLKINIRDLPDVPLRVARKLDAGSVRALLEGVVELAEGEGFAEIDLEVSAMGEVSPAATIFVRGRMCGQFFVPCSRCLEPARISLSEDTLMLTYLPRAAYERELGDEVELDVEDLDSYAHDGEQLDFGSLLREHLVLSIPIAPRCDDSCPGIEPQHSQETPQKDLKEGWKNRLLQLRKGLDN